MQQIRPAWVGRKVVKFTAPPYAKDPTRFVKGTSWAVFSGGVRKCTINEVSRYAKYVIVHLDRDLQFWTIHPSQTGWLLPGNEIAEEMGPPDPIHNNFIHSINPKNIKIKIHLDDGQIWHYHDPRTWGEWRLSCVNWVVRTYGPDWLLDAASAQTALLKVQTNRRVKDVICDQNIACGVGNYLACEALFYAKIDPSRNYAKVGSAERLILGKSIRWAITQAMANSDHEYWWVFQRKGQQCKRCWGKIAYRKDGARGTYYCPRCQI